MHGAAVHGGGALVASNGATFGGGGTTALAWQVPPPRLVTLQTPAAVASQVAGPRTLHRLSGGPPLHAASHRHPSRSPPVVARSPSSPHALLAPDMSTSPPA